MFEKEYTLYNVLLKILINLTINEIIIWIGIILFLIIISGTINITLFQSLLICTVVFLILMMVQLKQNETNNLQENTKLSNTNNKSLLKFIENITYFKLYNPAVYDDFMNKVKNYINLLRFSSIHKKNNYKLYPKKIIRENIEFYKESILETFASFEHTIDDRITSVYKLRELTDELKTILTKSNLII
jgi:hypothetical protein